jgi:predicted O-linked N-acetylglucosamine transferase (SPINDLY family)
MGVALAETGDLNGAIACYQRALELNEQLPATLHLLLRALSATGRLAGAVDVAQRAARLWPDNPETWQELGVALCLDRRDDEAVAAFEKAIQLKPDHYLAHSNLGHALQSRGEFERAIASFDNALEIRPESSNVASNRLFVLQNMLDAEPQRLRAELDHWDARFAAHLRDFMAQFPNDRSPDRPLRVGYVSADFRKHVVGWNLLPILTRHDRSRFQIYLYSNTERRDEMTEKLEFCVDGWRNILGVSDDQAAQMVRQDEIDILVDLSLHSAGNRLLLFARKPAPVQVTYLGYAGSTGLRTMDYRLSDPYLDPPGAELSGYSEETIRLPHSYWCYQSGGPTPDVQPAPSLKNGYFTFGCMTNFSKVSGASLELWGHILAAMPTSHLLMYCGSEPRQREVIELLGHHGASPDRIEFVGWQQWNGYISTYHRIDVGLDPFPRAGGITTCDSLYMGVPVITLAGKTAIGRGGCTVLSNVGLPQLIASSQEDYLKLAMRAEEWTQLRPTLRERMRSSPLMDAKGFTHGLEAVYRIMWNKWVENQTSV